uniref:Uncharacterized protein n=1 Tax=Anguilla anguilla TaxID=7936 RepID=A0A0E9SK41_ANGAN
MDRATKDQGAASCCRDQFHFKTDWCQHPLTRGGLLHVSWC